MYARQSIHITDNLVEEIIHELKKTFVQGYMINVNFLNRVKTDSKYAHSVRQDTTGMNRLLLNSPQYKDKYFTWNANRIFDDSIFFIAGQGPKKKEAMSLFFENTVFNDRCPIQHIIALGDELGTEKTGTCSGTFYDYCVRKRTEKYGPYTVRVERMSGTALDQSKERVLPYGIVQSRLWVSRVKNGIQEIRILNVTVIRMVDNTPLYLTRNNPEEKPGSVPFMQSFDERMKILLKQFDIAEKNPVFVHCASGIGRTGHIIVTGKMLKEYDRIFAIPDPKIIAKNILEIVRHIRVNRPALIHVTSQLEEAVRNVVALHAYRRHRHALTHVPPVMTLPCSTRLVQKKLIFQNKNLTMTPPSPVKPKSKNISPTPTIGLSINFLTQASRAAWNASDRLDKTADPDQANTRCCVLM